jgi:hypothetical protein
MASDRARISFEPSRQWRSVISQQGRVTVEADANEANAIAAAERRAELVETVGPTGTPDDGYGLQVAPSGAPAGDFTVGHGTMYVGGERVRLEADLAYSSQADWIDSADDPLWVAPAVPSGANEAVYLLLREQEVGAVEDPALRDAALGGPDTSARTRIIQRVVRAPTTGTDCAGALADLETAWAAEGLAFDPATMSLRSGATLQVSYQPPPTIASLCEPNGQGGYVGAENQLVRVQVSGTDESGNPQLVWGFDNASFLYRITGPLAAGATKLTLASAPVDSYHQPQAGQAVEILEAAAQLTDSDYVAAATGVVTTLTQPYITDTRQVVLAAGVTGPQANSPLLFMRVWQGTLAWASGPIALADTGIAVTLTPSGTGSHVGDYWTFAVRPGTPSTVSPVYPERILAGPQPPDGPAIWATQLGLLTWPAEGSTPAIADCRHQFDDLVTLSERSNGCCSADVTPDDVDGGAGLQAVLDRLVAVGIPATLCLQPGTYTLPAPLVIPASASGLTIESCIGGAVLQAQADDATPPASNATFTLGLIVSEGAPHLTLRGLTLIPPTVLFPFPANAIGGLPERRQALLTAFGNELRLGFGVALLGGGNVLIERCAFHFPDVTAVNLFSAGILAMGTIPGAEVRECAFAATEPDTTPFSDIRLGTEAAPPYQVRFGYLHMPTQAPATPPRTHPAPATVVEAAGATAAVQAAATQMAAARGAAPAGAAPAGAAQPEAAPAGAAQAEVLSRVSAAAVSSQELSNPAFTNVALTNVALTDPGVIGAVAGPTINPVLQRPIPRPVPIPVPIPRPIPLPVPPAPSLTTPILDDAVFADDIFDGLTVPILVLGDIGAVWVTDNSVRACYGGFWLLPADADSGVALLDRLDSTNADVASFTVSGGIAALTDPVLWLATAVCRLLPQRPPPPLQPVPITIIDHPPLIVLANAVGLLNVLSGLADSGGSGSGSGGGSASPSGSGSPAAPGGAAAGGSGASASASSGPAASASPGPAASASSGPAASASSGPAASATPGPAASASTPTPGTPHSLAARMVDPTIASQTVEQSALSAAGETAAAAVEPSLAAAAGTAAAAVEPSLASTAASSVSPLSARLGSLALENLLPIDIGNLFIPVGSPAAPPGPPPADPGTGQTPRLDVRGNQVDAVVHDSYSGAALLVAVMVTDTTVVSSASCTGNRLRGRVQTGSTVSLQQLIQCTVTANLVSNEIADDPSAAATGVAAVTHSSMVLRPGGNQKGPAVAVTGNVLIGDQPALPPRPLNEPWNRWDPLNTITHFVPPTPPPAAVPANPTTPAAGA